MQPHASHVRVDEPGGSYAAGDSTTARPSPRARQRSWPFWLWLLLALLGEIGLALIIIGPLVEGYLLWASSALTGVSAPVMMTLSFGWWTACVLSVLALVFGLRGLAREQREARRRGVASPDDSVEVHDGSQIGGRQAA